MQFFEDEFESGRTYASYAGLGGATVAVENGRLSVKMPDPLPANGAGFRIDLPPPANKIGVRCLRFDKLLIPEAPAGSFMNWTWYGFDSAGGRAVVLETRIEKTTSFTVRHRKANGTLVTQLVPDKSWSDVETIRWDTRRDGKEVQLEIRFKDGTSYNSAWLDPPPSLIAGFELLATVPSFSIGLVEGSEYHWEPATRSGLVPAFGSKELDDHSTYFIGQGVDADLVAVATVAEVGQVGEPLPDDPRPRLRVLYQLDTKLKGSLDGDRFVVLHAVEKGKAAPFEPNKKFILYLQRGAGGGKGETWFRDYGESPGIIPFSAQNLEAVFGRL